MSIDAPNMDWVEGWLTPGRLQKYRRASGGSEARALALYEWNMELAHAVLRDLAHLEVALRNSYDIQLGSLATSGSDWFSEDERGVLFPPHWVRENGQRSDKNSTPRSNIKKACKRVGNGAPRGKVVAELTFGFWTYLTDDLHEKTLWVPALHRSFAPGTDRKSVHDALIQLRDMRNRAAHHESVFDNDPNGTHRRVVSVAKLITPDLATHIRTSSRVLAVWRAKPKA